MTREEALIFARNTLKPLYGSESTQPARWLLQWVTHSSSGDLFLKTELTDKEWSLLSTALEDHVENHKPLAYIIGDVHFLGLNLLIRPPILIPRPETEYGCALLVEKLKTVDNTKITILDMCTGSGCIALSLAYALPDATVYAIDNAHHAVQLAQENANRLGLSLHILSSDLFSALPQDVRFDLIVSNPPYISLEEFSLLDKSVRNWEDHDALFALDNGLDLIKKIVFQSRSWLKTNQEFIDKKIPQLALEIGYNQGIVVQDIFSKAGFVQVTLHNDESGKNRFVTGSYNGT